MSLAIAAEPVPIAADADGVMRVAGTRVTLDTIVGAFQRGATPETIAQQYPTVSLADVFSVISYYLHHRAEVDAHLEKNRQHAEQVRRENEALFNPVGIRARLLARRNAQG